MIFFELEHFGRKKHLRPGHQRRRFRSTRIIKTMSGKPGNESFFGLGSTCWMIWFDEGWEPCSCVLDYSVARSPLDQCPKHALQTQLEIIYVCLLSGSYDYINIGYYAVTFFSAFFGLSIYSFWSRRREGFGKFVCANGSYCCGRHISISSYDLMSWQQGTSPPKWWFVDTISIISSITDAATAIHGTACGEGFNSA